MNYLFNLFVLGAATNTNTGKNTGTSTGTSTGSLTTDIYTAGDNQINASLLKIIKLVGGIGGSAFTLAVLIIALLIIFGSISSQKMRTVWIALISCVLGAFLFFSAYLLAPTIAGVAQTQ